MEEGSEGGSLIERETRVVSSHPRVEGTPRPQSKLLIPVKLIMSDGEEKEVMALLYTGAEVNLVQLGLIAEKYFRRSQHPK